MFVHHLERLMPAGILAGCLMFGGCTEVSTEDVADSREKARQAERDAAEAYKEGMQAAEEEAREAEEARQEAEEVEARFQAQEARDQFVSDTEGLIREAEDRIDQLNKQVRDQEPPASDRMLEKISALEDHVVRLKEAIGNINSADALKWTNYQPEAQQAFDDLAAEMKDVP